MPKCIKCSETGPVREKKLPDMALTGAAAFEFMAIPAASSGTAGHRLSVKLDETRAWRELHASPRMGPSLTHYEEMMAQNCS